MFAPLWGVSVRRQRISGRAVRSVLSMRVLEPEDQARLTLLTRSLPKSIGGPVESILSLMIRPRLAAVSPTNV
jgi:hypothetical protein